MSTNTTTMTEAEKVQRLRARRVVALGQALRWEELAEIERQDLDGELEYLEDTFHAMGYSPDADEVEGVRDVLRLKVRAYERAYDLGLVLETMAHRLKDRKVTARDLLPYAWEILNEDGNR